MGAFFDTECFVGFSGRVSIHKYVSFAVILDGDILHFAFPPSGYDAFYYGPDVAGAAVVYVRNIDIFRPRKVMSYA